MKSEAKIIWAQFPILRTDLDKLKVLTKSRSVVDALTKVVEEYFKNHDCPEKPNP